MLRETFYYLLGGFTFLPLCVLSLVLYIYLYAPSVHETPSVGVASDVDLTQETKLEALDLAAKNAAIHDEIEKSQGKDLPQGTASVPATAKRLGPKPSSSATPLKPFSSGWLTVRSQFESDKDAATAASPATANIAAASVGNDGFQLSSQDLSDPDTHSIESVESASALNKAMANSSGYMSQMYRGILDYRIGKPGAKKPTSEQPGRSVSSASASSSTPTGTAGRESFYCILKAPILYLYSSDDVSNPNTECHAAIDLRGKRVSIFVAGIGDTLGDLDVSSQHKPEAEVEADEAGSESASARHGWKKAKRAVVRDGELFMKRNAIRIVGPASRRSRSPALTEDQNIRAGRARRRPQWFIFCKNNYFMEDWYHALIQSSLMPEAGIGAKSDETEESHLPSAFKTTDDPIGPIFSRDDMASLLISLDNLTDPLPLRWLNALIGRIFFSIYRTAWLENYITSKIMKKLTRVKTPGFLGDIKVEEVDVGRRAPAFSRPMLKALTDDGEASMEIALHYVGEIRITISTTLSFSLGSRFKPYNIPIVLAVVLRSLEGNLLLHVKPPPSNRLWFGFTAMPKLEIDIEPVVSERKVQWGMVTRLIESRLRELLIESIVVPNMDDMPFFDTRAFFFRGGIFADAVKNPEPASTAATAAVASAGAEESETSGPSLSTNLKPSDASVSQNTTANSAPVSGVATPIALAGGENETLEPANAAGSHTSLSGSHIETALRNRKAASDAQPPSTAGNRMSSPAVAGLSDLLSRDLAAGGGSTISQQSISGSPPRHDSKSSAKRKMWFGASPRTSANSTSSSGLSALGGSLGGRSHREQGSLALGNASIERPGVQSNSATVLGKTGNPSLDVQPSAPIRPKPTDTTETDSIVHSGENNITSSDAGTASSRLSADVHDLDGTVLTSAATDAQREPLSQRDGYEENDQAKPRSDAPFVLVSDVPKDGDTALDSSASLPATLDINRALHASVLTDLPPKDFVNSPSSLTHSTKSPASSVRREDRDSTEPVGPDTASLSGTSHSARSSLLPTSSAASMRSEKSFDMDDGLTPSNARSTQYGFAPPPPPPRRPLTKASPSDEKSRYHQDAAAALSNAQKNRYGLTEATRETTEDGPGAGPALTSAVLWSRAKASMADKESRQAAAKEAKDAIKRGWSSWNAKRAEAKRGQQIEPEYVNTSTHDSMTPSHASRMSLVPGQSAWLASSPPDPTSFGLGFDKASPEEKRNQHILPALPRSARQNVGDTDDDGGSAQSSSSGRQPYREHRAFKKAHPLGSSERDSDEFSPSLLSTSRMPSTLGPDSDISGMDDAASSTQDHWAAETPSLPAPAPVAYRAEADGRSELERQNPAADSTSSRARADSAASKEVDRPALPRRKFSSSISSNNSNSGVSFIPTAPSTTTSLASTAGFPSSTPQDAASVQNLSADAASQDIGSQSSSTFSELSSTSSRSPSSTFRALSADRSPGGDASDLKTGGHLRDPLSTPTPDDASTLRSSGIKKQPVRAAMMAVPGIPSMQKSGPQSFSAPAPPPSTAAATSSPSLRRSSLFKLPFGSPTSSPAGLVSEHVINPPSADPMQDEAGKPEESRLDQSATSNKSASNATTSTAVNENDTFASVAKADGPSADPAFEEALMDRGASVQVGETSIKLADGTRANEQVQ